jgi:beta-glucosidase
MHHFSSPKWVITQGGWENPKTADLFASYCKRAVSELSPLLEYVATINEANMGLQIAAMMKTMQGDVQLGVNTDMSFIAQAMGKAGEAFGCDPRNINTFVGVRTPEGDRIVMKAHEKARDAMKEACPDLKVGVTLSLYDVQVLPGGEENALEIWDSEFSHYLPYIKDDDFIGVQNYTRKIVDASGEVKPDPDAPVTQMGYENYPQAIGNVLRAVSKDFKQLILITENGIAASDDKLRVTFIEEATKSVLACVKEGINVNGYFHWSLLDNYEWQLGFSKTFGLIAVDRKTQTRYPKESLAFLGSLAGK